MKINKFFLMASVLFSSYAFSSQQPDDSMSTSEIVHNCVKDAIESVVNYDSGREGAIELDSVSDIKLGSVSFSKETQGSGEADFTVVMTSKNTQILQQHDGKVSYELVRRDLVLSRQRCIPRHFPYNVVITGFKLK